MVNNNIIHLCGSMATGKTILANMITRTAFTLQVNSVATLREEYENKFEGFDWIIFDAMCTDDETLEEVFWMLEKDFCASKNFILISQDPLPRHFRPKCWSWKLVPQKVYTDV